MQTLFPSKGNHKQNENTTHRMGENICRQEHWKGINFQNLQTAPVAQYQTQTNKQPNKSWIEDLMDIFPKKIYTWPTSTWKDVQHC